MQTTKLSTKGQVTIPISIRQANNWKAGLDLVVIQREDGVLLKPKRPFPPTTIDEVAGCLKYDGPPISIEEMDEAIRQAILEEWGDRS